MTPEITATAVQNNLNVVWTLIAAILVFMMQAGFALVETGFTRAKNAANIMMKNLMDFAAGSLAFYILGAALMFGATKAAGWFGWGAGIFFALKKLGILRVSPKTELKGLDLVEHGQDAYASFQFFSNT